MTSFAALWRDLEPLGRDAETGGYRRYSWSEADTRCRSWFIFQAEQRGLAVEPDNNGNLWAWWGPRGPSAIATGSHLDSVPDGGGYDGARGVVSALAAVDLLKEENLYPERPVVLVAFTEEEGARFGVPCLGSRLLTGAVRPDAARALTDDTGTTLAEAMSAAGYDASRIGPRDDLLDGIAAFVELHVEQGRALATFGKVIADPGGSNAVPSAVRAWLDARAADEATLRETVTTVRSEAMRSSVEHGVTLTVRQESYTPPVRFDQGLRDRVAAALAAALVIKELSVD